MVQQAPLSAGMILTTKLISSRFREGKVEGQRLTGRFAFAKVGSFGSMGSSQTCLVGFGDVTATPESAIGINPFDIFAVGSRELYESLPYTQFKFKKFALNYVSQVPSTDTVSLAMTYYADPSYFLNLDEDTSAFDTILTAPNSLACQAWTTGVVLDVSDQLSQNWFWVDGSSDEGGSAPDTSRLEEQGMVWVQLSDNDGKNSQKGLLYVDYVLDLIEPRYVAHAPSASLSSVTKAGVSRNSPLVKRRLRRVKRQASALPIAEGKDKKREVPLVDQSVPDVEPVPLPPRLVRSSRRSDILASSSERGSSTEREESRRDARLKDQFASR